MESVIFERVENDIPEEVKEVKLYEDEEEVPFASLLFNNKSVLRLAISGAKPSYSQLGNKSTSKFKLSFYHVDKEVSFEFHKNRIVFEVNLNTTDISLTVPKSCSEFVKFINLWVDKNGKKRSGSKTDRESDFFEDIIDIGKPLKKQKNDYSQIQERISNFLHQENSEEDRMKKLKIVISTLYQPNISSSLSSSDSDGCLILRSILGIDRKLEKNDVNLQDIEKVQKKIVHLKTALSLNLLQFYVSNYIIEKGKNLPLLTSTTRTKMTVTLMELFLDGLDCLKKNFSVGVFEKDVEFQNFELDFRGVIIDVFFKSKANTGEVDAGATVTAKTQRFYYDNFLDTLFQLHDTIRKLYSRVKNNPKLFKKYRMSKELLMFLKTNENFSRGWDYKRNSKSKKKVQRIRRTKEVIFEDDLRELLFKGNVRDLNDISILEIDTYKTSDRLKVYLQKIKSIASEFKKYLYFNFKQSGTKEDVLNFLKNFSNIPKVQIEKSNDPEYDFVLKFGFCVDGSIAHNVLTKAVPDQYFESFVLADEEGGNTERERLIVQKAITYTGTAPKDLTKDILLTAMEIVLKKEGATSVDFSTIQIKEEDEVRFVSFKSTEKLIGNALKKLSDYYGIQLQIEENND